MPSDESSPGRNAALRAYLEAVPSYKLAMYDGKSSSESPQFPQKRPPSIFYSFVIGRVKFIVTDLRSSRGKCNLHWRLLVKRFSSRKNRIGGRSTEVVRKGADFLEQAKFCCVLGQHNALGYHRRKVGELFGGNTIHWSNYQQS